MFVTTHFLKFYLGKFGHCACKQAKDTSGSLSAVESKVGMVSRFRPGTTETHLLQSQVWASSVALKGAGDRHYSRPAEQRTYTYLVRGLEHNPQSTVTHFLQSGRWYKLGVVKGFQNIKTHILQSQGRICL